MKQFCTRFLSLLLICVLVCGLGVAVSAKTAVTGDVNNDGECTILDVLLVLKSILNDTELDGADINGDGKVSLVDVFRVMRLAISGNAPEIGETESGTADITVENGATKDAVSLSGENVSAAVPAGVAVKDGATSLTLSVTAMDNTTGNIAPGETEEALSYDVHIEGVSAENTVPIIVDLGAILPIGQNTGTVKLYHVENGVTNAMTQVMTLADLDAHNEFYYYPATGNVFVALATFSEITMVSDTVNAWNGSVDTTWYTKENANETEFTIANADQLAGFAQIVGGMAAGIERDSFKGKTVTLAADINLGDSEASNSTDILFYPIGYYFTEDKNSDGTTGDVYSTVYSFEGTFDGTGHTIANFYQNTWEMTGDYNSGYPAGSNHYNDAMGLFGYIVDGTVRNLTVRNFSSDGEFAPTGVVTAYAKGNCTFENISLFDCNPRTYNTGVAGIVGWDDGGDDESEAEKTHYTFKNITIDNSNTVSALWGSWDVAAAGILGYLGPKSTADFIECNVAAKLDVNNDVCANYQYYWYRYCGMLIGTVDRTDATGAALDLSGITAKDCNVNFGDWNDYYYCELVYNSKASYTHDHQFSKLVEVDSVDKMTTTGTNHYVIVDRTGDTPKATCYHYINGALHTHASAGEETVNGETVAIEDKTLVNLPFNQIFGGYGWGVKGTQFDELAGIEVLGITKGDVAESSEKFEPVAEIPVITDGASVTIGALFTANVARINNIKTANVQVSVSAVNGSNVTAVYTANTTDWTQGTLTFSGSGAATVTIQDYNFCTPTTVTVTVTATVVSVEKFTPSPLGEQNAYTQISLGKLFSTDATLGAVTATVTDPSGNETIITAPAADWSAQTIALVKDGTWTVSITDDDNCIATENTFTVNTVDKFVKKFDKDFLYRVGNKNAVALGSLFSEIETAVKLSFVDVTVENIAGNASGEFTSNATWTEGTIQFSGTGVVEVTISASGANAVTLNLEVVDATNLTYATGTTSGGNFVLLRDVNASDYVYYWNCNLYGNGFTYSLNGAPTNYSSSHGHGVLITKNATLDNLVIVGDIYEEYGAYTNNNDYNAAIDIMGDTVIRNCYISGCSAPISTRANATISATTLYGGAVANLIIKGGTVTLENVTTANYDDGRSLVGMGIVIHSDAAEDAKLVLNGTLTQYNFINESKTPSNPYAKHLHNAMFNDSCSTYHFGTSPNRYVNTGIISLTTAFDIDDITDNANTEYEGQKVTESELNGYVYTQPNTNGSVNNNYSKDTDPHIAATQGAVPPSYSFDYTTKNYVAKVDGSNDFCYAENGTVQISMDDGDTFDWDASILTVTKGKKTIDYTVSMDGTDYTGKSIAFNSAGDYKVVYTYTDSNNYKLDENGNITTYEKTYTQTVEISVAVIKTTTKHAEFTMGSSNAATEMITIDNATYVSATGVTADNSTWTYITIGSQKIYYPIVAAKLTSTKGSSTYAHFPVFENVITITDYADNGTGNAFTYNSSTTTLPSALTAVKGIYKAASDVPYWYNLTNSNLTQSGPSKIFKWASSSDAPSDPVTYNNVLCYKSPQISADRVAYITLVQYSYTDATNTTYYYYVGYTLEAFTKQSTCITPDTLVTLADGTQKRIDETTYEDTFLVWDFFKGEYTTAPASIIDNHGYNTVNVVTVNFANGASVNTINGHGFFDAELNKFVLLDEDNVADYVGHTFLVQSEDGFAETVLASYSIEEKYTEVWSILTAEHYNCILESMLTLTAAQVDNSPAYLMPFAIGDDMRYDADAMAADIAEYGLYTYEEFADLITYEQFAALNLQYFKVAVGKGAITYDEILYLLDLHMSSEN